MVLVLARVRLPLLRVVERLLMILEEPSEVPLDTASQTVSPKKACLKPGIAMAGSGFLGIWFPAAVQSQAGKEGAVKDPPAGGMGSLSSSFPAALQSHGGKELPTTRRPGDDFSPGSANAVLAKRFCDAIALQSQWNFSSRTLLGHLLVLCTPLPVTPCSYAVPPGPALSRSRGQKPRFA